MDINCLEDLEDYIQRSHLSCSNNSDWYAFYSTDRHTEVTIMHVGPVGRQNKLRDIFMAFKGCSFKHLIAP